MKEMMKLFMVIVALDYVILGYELLMTMEMEEIKVMGGLDWVENDSCMVKWWCNKGIYGCGRAESQRNNGGEKKEKLSLVKLKKMKGISFAIVG